MADEGFVEGMMLRRRQFDIHEACQLDKQRAKAALKHLDRGATERNELVFADILFPPRNYNCTRFKAVLVIIDAHTKFVTAFPVKDETKEEVNPLFQRYVTWAERHCPGCKVRTVFSDGGGELINDEITNWYQGHGIVHTTTPRNSLIINMVERSHQTLDGMMKSMMKEAGLPTSFWVDALHYAVYLKNRSYSTPIEQTSYEAMWNRKLDIHHVRKFEALAYVHSKVGPSRHKYADNCRVGFTLGYRENALGCKVYFPTEGSVLFGGQVIVNEQVLYKDRHGPPFEDNIRQWVVDAYPNLNSARRRDYDLPAVGGREHDTGVHHGGSDGEETLVDDEDTVGKVQRTAEAPHASWMNREPPVLNDAIVFTNPVQPSSGTADELGAESQDPEGDQEAGASGTDGDSTAGIDYVGDQNMDATKYEEGGRQNNDEVEGDYSDAGEDEAFDTYPEDDSDPYDDSDVQSQQSYNSRDGCPVTRHSSLNPLHQSSLSTAASEKTKNETKRERFYRPGCIARPGLENWYSRMDQPRLTRHTQQKDSSRRVTLCNPYRCRLIRRTVFQPEM
ncbi:hypothetical protein PF007_g17656 [Phytophthora fragariae]|uniref:Integrase catalytic domain-containing protein n=1 Tax=Phytophthora fragariae TaxID=53985 RepID=A0A6A4CXR5_9STRA|nr:hypothetical protein PF003_g25168 [Phytophthora fragariae]KAE8931498.1 hypothetical protein PF009_g18446 [Phytophthora fragariae]KAE9094760.1 hypothetical protein PF007_g17656 [Phytophthora fragariae]KAE9128001.1 hypothetical protein PF006_g16389 [Phytophthora fragariae]KAE9296982.1 hypothetical protein PF001_g16611 [Phytophthora fragariae]